MCTLDKKLINKINSIYNLDGEVKFLSVVKKGFLSENYILKNKERKFFLKKYRPFGLDRLKETHRVKKFFNKNGIPVIMPIPSKTGETFFKWANDYFSLFPFVDERQVKVNKINNNELESCAELLAKIHLLSKEKCPKLVNERGLLWDTKISLEKSKVILDFIKKKKAKAIFDKEIEKYLLYKIKLINKNKINYKDLKLKSDHIIHGDFHEENLFFDKDGNIVGIFDWEKANKYPRVLEIVRAMWFLCFYDGYSEKRFKRAQIFLRKYNEIYPLNKSELERGLKAWYLNQLHSMWVLDEIYLKNNKRVKVLFKSYVTFLNYQSRNLDKFSEIILSYF